MLAVSATEHLLASPALQETKAKLISAASHVRHHLAASPWVHAPTAAAQGVLLQVTATVQSRTRTTAGADTLVAIAMISFIMLGMLGLLALFSQHWSQHTSEQEAKHHQHQFYALPGTADAAMFGSLR